jgi:hypothetical protein
MNVGIPKQYPDQAINWYQSNLVSISFTPSPISSGPMKTGKHNSSTAQRCWRRFFYFLIIRTWQVDEIEFQYILA